MEAIKSKQVLIKKNYNGIHVLLAYNMNPRTICVISYEPKEMSHGMASSTHNNTLLTLITRIRSPNAILMILSSFISVHKFSHSPSDVRSCLLLTGWLKQEKEMIIVYPKPKSCF